MISRTRQFLGAVFLAVVSHNLPAAELLVPAYFYPSFDPAQNPWIEMQAALPQVKITAIMNPGNGPGTAFNGDYGSAVSAFQSAGGRVLGYVYTCYGNNNCVPGLPSQRSVADVLDDVERYATFYPNVNGIFLDEMSNRSEALGYYSQVSSAIRMAHPSWQIIGNAGSATPVGYLSVVDTVVTFEQGSGNYDTATSEPWMKSANALQQAHLHHSVATATAMSSLLSQAGNRNAGYIYITDDTLNNPFDRLPSYWNEEVAAIASVPEPPTLLMFIMGGIVMTGFMRRK